MTEEEFYLTIEAHKLDCEECRRIGWTIRGDRYPSNIAYCGYLTGAKGVRQNLHPIVIAAAQYLPANKYL